MKLILFIDYNTITLLCDVARWEEDINKEDSENFKLEKYESFEEDSSRKGRYVEIKLFNNLKQRLIK